MQGRMSFCVEKTPPHLPSVARNPNNQRRPWCYVQVGLKQLVQECMLPDCAYGEYHRPGYDGEVGRDKLMSPYSITGGVRREASLAPKDWEVRG